MSIGLRQNLEPFFVDTGSGRRFALLNRPQGKPRGAVLYVPPFAEEMNKSRRMAALAARAMSEDGWLVVRFDLQGCGDSEGDFAEATWQGWQNDLTFWTDWLHAHTDGPVILWTLRAGALLATNWVENTGTSIPLLLWQPVSNGKRYLTQFLRLRAVAQMLDARESKGVVSKLQNTLVGGEPVTVAGYTLNPQLANPLSSAQLSFLDSYTGGVAAIEIVGREDASPSPAMQTLVAKWTNSRLKPRLSVVSGPPFWQTVETEIAPTLVEATVVRADQLSR